MTPCPLAQISRMRRTLGQPYGMRGTITMASSSPMQPPMSITMVPSPPSPSHLLCPSAVLAQRLGEVAVGSGTRPLAHVEDGFDEGPEALGWVQVVGAERQVLGGPEGAKPQL